MKFKKLLAGVCALTMVAALSACTLETTDSESSKTESSAAESKEENAESSGSDISDSNKEILILEENAGMSVPAFRVASFSFCCLYLRCLQQMFHLLDPYPFCDLPRSPRLRRELQLQP